MLKETLLNEILREYEQIRARCLRSLEKNEKIAFNAVPQIEILRTAYLQSMLDKLKENLQKPISADKETNLTDNLYIDLKKEETRLLVEHGFSADFLTLKHVCNKCEDTGFVGWPVKEKCSCLSQKLLTRLYELSDFADLDFQNFDTFNLSIFPELAIEGSKLNQREYMKNLKELLLNYAVNFPSNEKKTILFSGKTGLGKTFLLNCMSKVILEKGHTTLRISAYNMSNKLFSSVFQGASDNQYIVQSLFDVELLIIDDLGTEIQRNNFTSEDLFNILNERMTKNKHTFLSTNLSLPELRDRYSDRITSRLYDTSKTMLVKFSGQDVRLKNR